MLSTMFTSLWWQDIFMLYFHVGKKKWLSGTFNASVPRYCPHSDIHRHRVSSRQPQELLLQLCGHADAPRVPQFHRPQVQEEDWDDSAQAGQDGGGGATHPMSRLWLSTPRDRAHVSWLQEPAALLRCHCECWRHCSQPIFVVEIKCHCSQWIFTVSMSLFPVNLCSGVNMSLFTVSLCNGVNMSLFTVNLCRGANVSLFTVNLCRGANMSLFTVNLYSRVNMSLFSESLQWNYHVIVHSEFLQWINMSLFTVNLCSELTCHCLQWIFAVN